MAGRPKRADGRNSNTEAHNRYSKDTYDKIYLALEKTEKEKLTIAAELAGQSLAQYVSEACNRRISEDSVDNPVLIEAMRHYYEDILLPARAERDARTKGKTAPERMPRPELELKVDDEGKLRAIEWAVKGILDKTFEKISADMDEYAKTKKAPEE